MCFYFGVVCTCIFYSQTFTSHSSFSLLICTCKHTVFIDGMFSYRLDSYSYVVECECFG